MIPDYLTKKVNNWVENSIITEEQKKAILAYEADNPKNGFSYLHIIGIGILTCLIGFFITIFDTISTGWSTTSDAIKILISIFALAVLSYGYYLANEKEKKKLQEILLFSLAVCYGLVIICLNELFDLDSSYDPYLFWSITVLPIVLKSKNVLLSGIWILLLTCNLIIVVDQLTAPFTNQNYSFEKSPILIPTIISLILLAISKLFKKLSQKYNGITLFDISECILHLLSLFFLFVSFLITLSMPNQNDFSWIFIAIFFGTLLSAISLAENINSIRKGEIHNLNMSIFTISGVLCCFFCKLAFGFLNENNYGIGLIIMGLVFYLIGYSVNKIIKTIRRGL